MSTTGNEFEPIIIKSKEIFGKKTRDYGTAWRVLRPSSLTDQLFIKAKRIRTIQEKGKQLIEENIEGEFFALINYSVMGLIQLELNETEEDDLSVERAEELFSTHLDKALKLLHKKNHDYGEAWRDMRVSSITDMILMKLLRIKQIENNEGNTLVSEGIDANYFDIINYSIFALIKLEEEADSGAKPPS